MEVIGGTKIIIKVVVKVFNATIKELLFVETNKRTKRNANSKRLTVCLGSTNFFNFPSLILKLTSLKDMAIKMNTAQRRASNSFFWQSCVHFNILPYVGPNCINFNFFLSTEPTQCEEIIFILSFLFCHVKRSRERER